jgi:hypothetical protein
LKNKCRAVSQGARQFFFIIKTTVAAESGRRGSIRNDLIPPQSGHLRSRSKDILGQNGLLKLLTKRLIECSLQAELTDHLSYAPMSAR